MRISDVIEQFIAQMMNDGGGEIEIRRNELAEHFNCVPSQINYVISTRFAPEKGYIVESRRGGGGSIRIRRISATKSGFFMHVVNSVGDSLNQLSAQILIKNIYESGYVTKNEAELMLAATNDKSIPVSQPVKDNLRALIFKNMLLKLV